MGQAVETLAHFIAETPWDAVPRAVRQHAKLVLLDTLGVILAGSVQPEVAGARARLTVTGGHGATIYAPGAPTADPRTAASSTGSPAAPSSCVKAIAMFPVRAPCRRCRPRWPGPSGCSERAARLWPRSSSDMRWRPESVRD